MLSKKKPPYSRQWWLGRWLSNKSNSFASNVAIKKIKKKHTTILCARAASTLFAVKYLLVHDD